MEIISLGLGVQSVALYYMSSLGYLPRADYAIMADPGKERKETYAYLQSLLVWQHCNAGIPIIVRQEKNLYEDIINHNVSGRSRFVSIPAYVLHNGSVGMLRRQCTYEYKIRVVDRTIRQLYGLKPRQRCPKTGIWKGISLDEIDRMTHPREGYKIHRYPFTGFWFGKKEYGRLDGAKFMDRAALMTWLTGNGFAVPQKSSCVFCPYRSDAGWRELKTKSPDDFAAAVKVDEAIRLNKHGKIKDECFLHKSLQPLSQIDFLGPQQLDFGECSDNCGV